MMIFQMGGAYPVGSIYLSVNSTNPSTLFGGTWKRIQDVFLLAAGSQYSAGSTGGEATHALTVDEMPSHTHYVRGSGFNQGAGLTASVSDSSDAYRPLAASSAGGNAAHNNMPPYLAVYMWKRTA